MGRGLAPPPGEGRRLLGGEQRVMRCPLCSSATRGRLATVDGIPYRRCGRCLLVFAEPDHRLEPEAERARYETHRNDPDDPGYRAFLDRLAGPLAERLEPGARGLDYGAGPGPTLSVMLEERGFPTRTYDPFFQPDPEPLEAVYDFVTCTETAEHFFEPGRTFEVLDGLLRPGGWLGIMTGVFTDDMDFASWWYVRDPTHVAFYAPETLRWIADRFRWTLERPSTNVALFRKAHSGTPSSHGV